MKQITEKKEMENQRKQIETYCKVMFITDIPSASVVSAITKRVFPMSSLGSQNQRRVFTILQFPQKRPLYTPWQDVVFNPSESTYSKK